MSLELAVDNFLSEHFKSYVFVAFDYEGVNHTYSNIKTQEEKDSLSVAMDRAYNDVLEEVGEYGGCDCDEDDFEDA
jgi:hypothetical protein